MRTKVGLAKLPKPFDLGVSELLHDQIFQRVSSFLSGHLTLCVSQNSISILLDR